MRDSLRTIEVALQLLIVPDFTRLEALLKTGPDLRRQRFLRLKAGRWHANFISPDEALEGILRREPIRKQQRLNDTAVAASILTAVYHMLKDGTCYQDLGRDHFDRRAKTAQTKRLVARLQNLGYAVHITPLPA
jgi:hypothetical protein